MCSDWSFFGTEHGKRVHDEVGAAIKRFLQQEQLNVYGVPLRNVTYVVNFLRERLFEKPKTLSTLDITSQ